MADANSDTRLLPIERNSAAPALYMPMNGYDSADSQKYVSAAAITSASARPTTNVRMCPFQMSTGTAMTTDSAAIAYISWRADVHALSLSRRPRYWLATTAPPVASAANT